MNVDQAYLDRFVVKLKGEPEKIPLNGEERFPSHVVNIDDKEMTHLAVTYRDEYVSPFDAVKGYDKRSTFVIPKRGAEPVEKVGYRFAGLIPVDELRTWYREANKITEDWVPLPE